MLRWRSRNLDLLFSENKTRHSLFGTGTCIDVSYTYPPSGITLSLTKRRHVKAKKKTQITCTPTNLLLTLKTF